MIPGPIGMASAAASAAAYAKAGDRRNATLMVAGIAAAAVGAGVAVKVAGVVKKAKTIVKAAAAGEKNLGTAGRLTSYIASRMWTKRLASNISKDGLTRYRRPAIKKDGQLVSNFERRLSASTSKRKAWSYPNKYINGHLTIKGWW